MWRRTSENSKTQRPPMRGMRRINGNHWVQLLFRMHIFDVICDAFAWARHIGSHGYHGQNGNEVTSVWLLKCDTKCVIFKRLFSEKIIREGASTYTLGLKHYTKFDPFQKCMNDTHTHTYTPHKVAEQWIYEEWFGHCECVWVGFDW